MFVAVDTLVTRDHMCLSVNGMYDHFCQFQKYQETEP